jgi:hypothetical protein
VVGRTFQRGLRRALSLVIVTFFVSNSSSDPREVRFWITQNQITQKLEP